MRANIERIVARYENITENFTNLRVCACAYVHLWLYVNVWLYRVVFSWTLHRGRANSVERRWLLLPTVTHTITALASSAT